MKANGDLCHPNVVSIDDVSWQNSELFLKMEVFDISIETFVVMNKIPISLDVRMKWIKW